MNMKVERQFSVFLVNKPGVLAQICQALAEKKINIKALTLVDSQEHGVLRVVVEDAARAARVLQDTDVPVTEAEVLCVEMPNRPGAMAGVCNRLADEHININYAYCTTGAKGGKAVGVFKIGDLKKAQRVLQNPRPQRKRRPVRRPTVKK